MVSFFIIGCFKVSKLIKARGYLASLLLFNSIQGRKNSTSVRSRKSMISCHKRFDEILNLFQCSNLLSFDQYNQKSSSICIFG